MNNFLKSIRARFAKNALKKVLYYGLLSILSLYVFSIPSFANRPGLNYICYALMAVLIAVIALYILLYGLERKFDKRTLLIIIFLATSLIGTISYSKQYRGVLTLVLMATSFFALYLAMSIVNNNKLICMCISLAFFAFAVYFIIHYREDILNYASYNYDEFRLGWDFENPNTVGSFMAVALSLSMFIVLFEKGKLRFLFIVPSIAFLLVGLTTGSRTFLISILVLTVCCILFKLKKHIFWAILIIASLVGIFILLINVVPFLATIKFRILDTLKMLTNGVSAGSTLERILWQRYGFYLGSRRLLFGYGESGFAYASGVMTYTHGNFTEMLCDFGLIGFVLFYCFNLAPGFISIFSKKPYKEYVIVISFVMLINGFLSVYYYDKCTYVIMALCYYLLDNAKPEFASKQVHDKKPQYCEVDI